MIMQSKSHYNYANVMPFSHWIILSTYFSVLLLRKPKNMYFFIYWSRFSELGNCHMLHKLFSSLVPQSFQTYISHFTSTLINMTTFTCHRVAVNLSILICGLSWTIPCCCHTRRGVIVDIYEKKRWNV